jgi:DtxR family Mn-dependent transcriptional regulator
MTEHPTVIDHTSESEEMYLITTARAVEDGHPEPVPVARIADDLGVSVVSANQMVRKLEGRGLVQYTPYKGVSLTGEGRRIAGSILRRRRLWGVFLAERLGLAPTRADAVACDMEHITPDDVADRLAEYLGDPTVGPTGRPIPRGADSPPRPTRALTDVAPGAPATIAVVTAPDSARTFLGDQGIAVGMQLAVVGASEGGAVLVSVDGRQTHLSAEAAAWILVEGP